MTLASSQPKSYTAAENQWLFTEYHDLSESFELQSVGITLSLGDLYEAVFGD